MRLETGRYVLVQERKQVEKDLSFGPVCYMQIKGVGIRDKHHTLPISVHSVSYSRNATMLYLQGKEVVYQVSGSASSP